MGAKIDLRVNILFVLINFKILRAKRTCVKLKIISIVSQVMLFIGCFVKSVTKLNMLGKR